MWEITSQKYRIIITLVFSYESKLETITLFDTSIDPNCINLGLVPIQIHQNTNEKLNSANNSKMNIIGKTKIGILNKTTIVKTLCVMVSDIIHLAILGTPFMNIITPYVVKHEKISFKNQGETLSFLFLGEPKTRNVNIIRANSIYQNEISTLIKGKEKDLLHLKQKIQFHTVKRELQKMEVKYQISKIINSFEKKFVLTYPVSSGIENNIY